MRRGPVEHPRHPRRSLKTLKHLTPRAPRADTRRKSMGTHTDARTRVHALAQTDEPTAEMIAASAAEAGEPTFVSLGVSEELSGGAGAMYLREIANHDLLNQQDEVHLAQRMEAGRGAHTTLNSGEAFDELH